MARNVYVNRFASLLALGCAGVFTAPQAPAAETRPPVTFIDQGWSKEIRELFYYTPQGSRLIPYSWFMALERADGTGLFSDTANLERFGFIPADGPHPLNPGGLPIGFAIDSAAPGAGETGAAEGDADLGLTCAACHSGNITAGNATVRIDGGPANLDFDAFLAELSAALKRTMFDTDAFDRFAARLFPGDAPTEQATLRLRLAEFQTRFEGDAALRHPTVRSGFGRVDALTQIVNALAAVDQSDPLNARPVEAPTSYPQLWLTPELEFVQWSPIAASPIGRNGGEVLGVFGKAALAGDPADWFASSIRIRDLHAVETWVEDLKSPRWDETLLGPIDTALAGRGEALFRGDCEACHNAPPYRRTDPAANHFGRTFIAIGRVPYDKVGTDRAYIESLKHRLVRTNAATAAANGGKAVLPAAEYFIRTAAAIIGRAMNEAGLSQAEKIAMSGFRFRPPTVPGGPPEAYQPDSIEDLKASPLPGAWATGPYLHNGSVATIYELLSPEAERRGVFWTGGRELDRERLGFASRYAPGRFRFDTRLAGNGNSGHLYPKRGFAHDERMAIIEYLKSL